MKKKLIAMMLVLAMMLALGSIGASAETAKHERVYVVAAPDGAVLSLTDTIHLENRDSLDEITDSTMLSDVQNVNGEQSFTLNDGVLTWEAMGEDITYQGTSDKTPEVLPVVRFMLDGEEVSASELAETEGDVSVEVTYSASGEHPALAVTAVILPEKGISGITAENATVMEEAGYRALVGWAVSGVDDEVNLPKSFRAEFHADHPEFSWMMTFVSGDPVNYICREADKRIDLDLQTELAEAQTVLQAMRNGDVIPETVGKTKDIVPKMNELNDGLVQLSDGAQQLTEGAEALSAGIDALNSGAKQLDGGMQTLHNGAEELDRGLHDAADGAAQLCAGLDTLKANNETLNAGAGMIFSAILDSANGQLAASGLADAGFTLPELTADNYSTVLSQLLEQLDPDKVKAEAAAKAEAVVRPQVEAQRVQIQAAVEEQIKNTVLEAVLQASQTGLTVEQFKAALQAGQVSAEQNAMIQTALQEQMASDEMKAKTEQAVQAQIDSLVAENVEKAIASDANAVAQLTSAGEAYESLNGLKNQLDQVNAFISGITDYTAGVEQIAAGAGTLTEGTASLAEGADQLLSGALQLKDGTATLSDGSEELLSGSNDLKAGTAELSDGVAQLKENIQNAEKSAAEKLLPYVEDDLGRALDLFEDIRDRSADCGYDLRSAGMDADTVYIIRTDLK